MSFKEAFDETSLKIFILILTIFLQLEVFGQDKYNAELYYDSFEEFQRSLSSTKRQGADFITNFSKFYQPERTFRKATYFELNVPLKSIGGGISVGSISMQLDLTKRVSIHAVGDEEVFNWDYGGAIIANNPNRYMTMQCEFEISGMSIFKFSPGVESYASLFYGEISRIDVSKTKIASRRIRVPLEIEGKAVTYRMLKDQCFYFFANKTRESKLKENLKNLLNSTNILKNNYTRCDDDHDCRGWFHNLVNFLKIKNTYRCVDVPALGYNLCQLRGLEGQNCPVIKNGVHVSFGFEFICDKGFECNQYQEKTWYQNGKGRCLRR